MNKPPPVMYGTLTGSIDEELTTRAMRDFTLAINAGVETVHLLIQSAGGIIGEGIGLYNYLRKLPLELIVYNGGVVASVAVPVFLAGRKRKASKTASFMIHKAYTIFNATTNMRATQLRVQADGLELQDRQLETIIFEQVRLPAEKLEMHKHWDISISPEEALASGLIHEIADFEPPRGANIFSIAMSSA